VAVLGGLERDECLAVAAALEQSSEHPLATALGRAAGVALPPATDVVAEPGQGIAATIAGRNYRIGRPAYALALGSGPLPEAAAAWLDSGDTVVALADATGCLALFRIGDEIRPESAALVGELLASGKKVVLLTGDAPAVARRVAGQLGITDVRAGVTPQGKRDCVTALQASGAVVAMVGDGVNDAPVLAAAQVSLAMGSGAQLAHATADMILLTERLEHLVSGVDKARQTLLIMRENFAWAIGYNLLAVPLAAGGWLTPWMSALGMSFSSLLVVVNALRLRQS